MTNHGTGWIRMEFLVPSRGLIGFRTEFLTETRGTGIAHQVFEKYEPWFGDLRTRPSGSMVSDRTGVATSYAMANLQERGTMFVDPGTEVYEGMVIGENSRADDMDVNITKEKKMTNVRSNADEPGAAGAGPQAVAGAVAGVLPRRRVRRGHPGRHPHPHGAGSTRTSGRSSAVALAAPDRGRHRGGDCGRTGKVSRRSRLGNGRARVLPHAATAGIESPTVRSAPTKGLPAI
nr:hypothetical protein [Angustibacter aerolatus]